MRISHAKRVANTDRELADALLAVVTAGKGTAIDKVKPSELLELVEFAKEYIPVMHECGLRGSVTKHFETAYREKRKNLSQQYPGIVDSIIDTVKAVAASKSRSER